MKLHVCSMLSLGFVILLSINSYGEKLKKVREFTRESDQKSLSAYVVSYDGKEVTLQVVGKKRYSFESSVFIEDDRKYLEEWRYKSRGLVAPSELDPRIKPGETFRVEMPDLAKTFTGKTAGFTVSIPTDFNYPEPVPVLVFLNGGSGDENIKGAKSIADVKRYVLVSFPYTSEIQKDGPLGQIESNMKLIESYHGAMLEKLQTLIPNLSPTHRIIAGSSNGAHIVGSALVMDWDCYLNFFRSFMLWEGGGSISRNFKAAKGKRYCSWAGWGSDSESKLFAMGVAKAMDDSRMLVTQEEVSGAGHGMNKNVSMAMRKWVLEVAEPALDKMAEAP